MIFIVHIFHVLVMYLRILATVCTHIYYLHIIMSLCGCLSVFSLSKKLTSRRTQQRHFLTLFGLTIYIYIYIYVTLRMGGSKAFAGQ